MRSPLRKAHVVLTLSGLLSHADPGFAHHGSTMFDLTQERVLEGVVTQFAWKNPHTYLTIRTRGATPVEPPEWSGEAVETALIWNGFAHQWGYNHRLNRLGNWIGPMACERDGCRDLCAMPPNGAGHRRRAACGWCGRSTPGFPDRW